MKAVSASVEKTGVIISQQQLLYGFQSQDINIDIILLLNLKTLANFINCSTNILFLLQDHMLYSVAMSPSSPSI